MLSDPLYLGIVATQFDPAGDVLTTANAGVKATFHTLATGDRTSKRRASGVTAFSGSGTDQLNLTMSHSDSKENSPYGTVRTNVRLDLTRVDENGKSVTASCYQVTVQPNAAVFTEADIAILQRTLSLFTFVGATDDSGVLVSDDDTISRLLNGEA